MKYLYETPPLVSLCRGLVWIIVVSVVLSLICSYAAVVFLLSTGG